MAAMYFRLFESTHRILHEPTFWTEYERYWDAAGIAKRVTRVTSLMVLLVIAIGSSVCEPNAGLRTMASHWVYSAQTWLSGPLEKDRLGFAGLQIHCLTILARQVLSIGADLVWPTTGQLVQSAMQLGLHRDPKYLRSMSVLQSELRRRLWATTLDLAVQSSLDAAMPPRMSLDEFDTEAPANLDDNELEEPTLGTEAHPRTTYTATSIQLLLLDSLPTRLRIVQLLNGLRSELSYPEALRLSSQLIEATRAHTSFFENVTEELQATPFRRHLLNYLVRRFLLPLHSFFSSKARRNPLFHYSLRVGLDASMALIPLEGDASFRRLLTVGGGPFREGFRCAGTAVCIELLAQVENQRLDGTLHQQSQYRDLLKNKVKDLLLFSEDRIRQGETNVKTHMFLSMVLAQVDAVEEGIPVEVKIAQHAKESLEWSVGLLQALADSTSVLLSRGATASFYDGQDEDWLESDVELLFGADLI